MYNLLKVIGSRHRATNLDDFVLEWVTTVSNEDLVQPLSAGFNYDFEYMVDGGSWIPHNLSTLTINIPTAGTHEIRYREVSAGGFPEFRFANNYDKTKVSSLKQWGANKWGRTNSMFYGCTNIKYDATDIPDLSEASTIALDSMFRGARFPSISFAGWYTTGKDRMAQILRDNTSLTSLDLGGINTSSMTTFSYAFSRTKVGSFSFAGMDTSNVAIWAGMFDRVKEGSEIFIDVANLDFTSTTNMSLFLNNNSISESQYNLLLSKLNTETIATVVTLGGGNSVATGQGLIDRQDLVNKGWIITDATKLPSEDFVFTQRTLNDGDSAVMPLVAFGTVYDMEYSIDGGATWTFINSAPLSIPFATAGDHEIRFRALSEGGIPRLQWGGTTDALNILSIDQWGTNKWDNLTGLASACTNIEMLATDIPDLSVCTAIAGWFTNCPLVNFDASSYDFSNIDILFNAWNKASIFSSDMTLPNTTNANGFSDMFRDGGMQGYIDGDFSLVTSFASMFRNRTYNQPIAHWDVRSATNIGNFCNGLTTQNYNDALAAWRLLPLQNGVNLGVGNSIATGQGVIDRQYIIDTFGWIITDATP